MKVLFNAEEHAYTSGTTKYLSVSKFLEQFKNKFDSDQVSAAYAKKHKLTQEEVLAQWAEKNRKSLEKGTRFHNKVEQEHIDAGKHLGYEIIGDKRQSMDISNLPPGDYCELIIPYHKCKLVGTSDRVIIYEDKTFTIRDYKTNTKLDFEGTAYFNPNTKKKEIKRMLAPINHLHDVNGIHYNLQLSLYSYFLETAGFVYKDGFIDHVILDDEGNLLETISYPINYLKTEVKEMINWYSTLDLF